MAGRHKEVIYVGYGVTLKTGLHRFPDLCYIAEFLRVFPYLFHHSKDLLVGKNNFLFFILKSPSVVYKIYSITTITTSIAGAKN